MNKELRKKINSLKNLPQYKGKTEEELLKIINSKPENINWVGLAEEEKPRADELYQQYRDNYHVEGYSDLEDLRTLVYNQILIERIAKLMGEGTKAGSIPKKLTLDSLSNLQKQVLDLKERLGLNKGKNASWLDWWKGFKQKLLNYSDTHKGEFFFQCPKCHTITQLLRRVKDYESFPCKMFKGTQLYNEPLMKFIEQGKLTKKEVAEVWGLPRVDYIDLIYKKIYLKEKHKKHEKEK